MKILIILQVTKTDKLYQNKIITDVSLVEFEVEVSDHRHQRWFLNAAKHSSITPKILLSEHFKTQSKRICHFANEGGYFNSQAIRRDFTFSLAAPLLIVVWARNTKMQFFWQAIVGDLFTNMALHLVHVLMTFENMLGPVKKKT